MLRIDEFTHEDTRNLIQEVIDSGEWWVLVDVGKSELPRIIRERYYEDGASADFRMLLGPDLAYQSVAFFIMHKTRMDASELADCVRDAGGEALPPALYDKRPFLFSPKSDSPTALAIAFYDWIRGP